MAIYEGIYENGVIKLLEPTDLKEGEEIRVWVTHYSTKEQMLRRHFRDCPVVKQEEHATKENNT